MVNLLCASISLSPGLVHAVKYRIHRTRTEYAAVAAQLLDQLEAEDESFGRVVQNVRAQKRQQRAMNDMIVRAFSDVDIMNSGLARTQVT